MIRKYNVLRALLQSFSSFIKISVVEQCLTKQVKNILLIFVTLNIYSMCLENIDLMKLPNIDFVEWWRLVT